MRACSICGRGANNANSRSHSNIATKRKQHVNLQTLNVGGRRVLACASCIRTDMKKLMRSEVPAKAEETAPVAA